MAPEQNNRDTLKDVAACVEEGLIYCVEETGFGEIIIKCKIYKEGLIQINVNRGTIFRFYIDREEMLNDLIVRRR
jgi:hypothetical protein